MKKLLFGSWVARLAWLMMLSWPMVGLVCWDNSHVLPVWNRACPNVHTHRSENDSMITQTYAECIPNTKGQMFAMRLGVEDIDKKSYDTTRRILIDSSSIPKYGTTVGLFDSGVFVAQGVPGGLDLKTIDFAGTITHKRYENKIDSLLPAVVFDAYKAIPNGVRLVYPGYRIHGFNYEYLLNDSKRDYSVSALKGDCGNGVFLDELIENGVYNKMCRFNTGDFSIGKDTIMLYLDYDCLHSDYLTNGSRFGYFKGGK